MSIERTQSPSEPQQELRFTARDPILDEALAMLEAKSYRQSEKFPHNLFIYSMKRLTVDTSDTYDGRSQNKADFDQYRHRIKQTLSERGVRKFALAPFMKPLHIGGQDGPVGGVGVRVVPDSITADQLITPPFYGDAERNAGYIPAYYRIEHPDDNLEEALDRLERVLKLGTWVAQLTTVPSFPVSARKNDMFLHEPLKRTYTRVDEALANEPPPNPPISLAEASARRHRSPNGGVGPDAA